MPLRVLDSLLKENGEKILLEGGSDIGLENAHEGFEVLDFWPNWEGPPSEGFDRGGTVLENVTGLPVVKPRSDQPRQSLEFNYRLTTRAELARFRRFIRSLRGRQAAFWTPTWEADLTLTLPIHGTDFTVESIGYEARLFPFNARKHMALIKWDRTLVLFGAVGATDNGVTELINTSISFGASPGFPVDQVMISFLLLVRLAEDDVQYTYISPNHMTATLRVIEVPLEAPAA